MGLLTHAIHFPLKKKKYLTLENCDSQWTKTMKHFIFLSMIQTNSLEKLWPLAQYFHRHKSLDSCDLSGI